MKEIENIFFDVDGTLFDTKTAVVPAILEAVEELFQEKISEKEIISYFGLPMNEFYLNIVRKFNENKLEEFYKLSKKKISKFITIYGQIYDNTVDTLEKLKKYNKKLYICSNGPYDYIDRILRKFDLNKYFEYISCYENDNDDKVIITKRLIDKFCINHFIMVGDRYHDYQAANEFNGIFIGAMYGYGNNELVDVNIKINNIYELVNIVC